MAEEGSSVVPKGFPTLSHLDADGSSTIDECLYCHVVCCRVSSAFGDVEGSAVFETG